MAGAAAEVLLRAPMSELEREQLRTYLRSVASCIENNAFWLAGQPFFFWTEETAAADDAWDADALGWHPRGCIGFAAGCRGASSDAYLAMLAARVAQMFDGVVALGGHIDWLGEDAILVMEGRYAGQHEDYVTPEFLHYWIGHAKFRMIN